MSEIVCPLETQPSPMPYSLYPRSLDSYKKETKYEIPLKAVHLEHLGSPCGLNQQECVASQNWNIRGQYKPGIGTVHLSRSL